MEVGLAGTDAPEGEAAGTGLPPVEDAVAGERSTPVEMTGGQPAEDGAAPTEAADRVPAGAVEEASVEEPLAEAGEVPAEEDASAAEAVGAEQPPEPAGEPSMAAPSSPAVLEPAGEEPTAATVEGPDAEAEEQEQDSLPTRSGCRLRKRRWTASRTARATLGRGAILPGRRRIRARGTAGPSRRGDGGL